MASFKVSAAIKCIHCLLCQTERKKSYLAHDFVHVHTKFAFDWIKTHWKKYINQSYFFINWMSTDEMCYNHIKTESPHLYSVLGRKTNKLALRCKLSTETLLPSTGCPLIHEYNTNSLLWATSASATAPVCLTNQLASHVLLLMLPVSVFPPCTRTRLVRDNLPATFFCWYFLHMFMEVFVCFVFTVLCFFAL